MPSKATILHQTCITLQNDTTQSTAGSHIYLPLILLLNPFAQKQINSIMFKETAFFIFQTYFGNKPFPGPLLDINNCCISENCTGFKDVIDRPFWKWQAPLGTQSKPGTCRRNTCYIFLSTQETDPSPVTTSGSVQLEPKSSFLFEHCTGRVVQVSVPTGQIQIDGAPEGAPTIPYHYSDVWDDGKCVKQFPRVGDTVSCYIGIDPKTKKEKVFLVWAKVFFVANSKVVLGFNPGICVYPETDHYG